MLVVARLTCSLCAEAQHVEVGESSKLVFFPSILAAELAAGGPSGPSAVCESSCEQHVSAAFF